MRIYSSPVTLLVMPRQFAQQGAVVLERPWYKCYEAVCAFWLFGLYLAYPNQMFKAFLDGFDMAEHHGGRAWQIKLVRCTHNIQPFFTTAFAFAYQAAYAVV